MAREAKKDPSELVAEKGCEKEFAFLELLEQRAIECFKKVKGTEAICSLICNIQETPRDVH